MPLQVQAHASRIPEIRKPLVGKGDVNNRQRKALHEIGNINSSVTTKVAGLKISNANLKPVDNLNKLVPKINKLKFTLEESNKEKPALKKTESEPTKKETIEDIDKLQSGNIFLVSEYAKDVYSYLMSLEVKFSINKWPLPNSKITEGMRTILIDWLVDVHLELSLLQETMHTTTAILDRYLQVDNQLEKEIFQLVGISALYLAGKYEETFAPNAEDLLYLCKNAYNRKQLMEMEMKMLKALNYDLGRPVSVVFLRRYNMAAKADKLQHCYSKYFIDSVLLDSNFSHIRPSLIAAGAAFMAMCIINKSHNPAFWTSTMVYYSTYKFSEVKPIASQMASFITKAYKSKHASVRRKYADSSFLGVSTKINASLDILKSIAKSCSTLDVTPSK